MGRIPEVSADTPPTAAERAEAKRRLLAPPDHPTPAAERTTRTLLPPTAESLEDEFARDWFPDAEPVGVRGRRVLAWARTHLRRILLVALAIVVVASLAIWLVLRDRGPAPLTTADVDQAIAKALQDQATKQAAQPADGATVYAAILPSLVVITTQGGPAPGEGAGTIVKDDGTILTAYHVVRDAPRITVDFADGTRSSATIASATPDQDIAVLTPATLPDTVVPATLGGGVGVGDEVFAVGHPLGYTASLSAGVVSGLNRSITVQGTTLSGLIQTDAAVNPGNSGGPLLNKAGQVVGVVTALANGAGQDSFAGIGFAVPIATAGGAAGAPPK